MPLDWNLNYFSLTGYASVLVWSGCLILLVLHFIFKPRQTVCHSALAIVFVAFALAKHNSLAYVNKIQPDLSQQKAELEAKIAAKQQEVLDDRGTQVAQIQFAEDGRDEFLDRAGLDDEDLETIDQIREELTPGWKKEKKTRSGHSPDSEGEGMDTSLVEESIEDEPVTMLEIDMMRANQYDYLNLLIIKILIAVSVLVIIYDYLRRHNLYELAYFPIKIPSALANLITPYPPVIDRSRQPRRSVAEELAWLTKRGDSFVYFSSNPENIKKAEEILVPFSEKKKGYLQLIKTVNAECSDDFVFERRFLIRHPRDDHRGGRPRALSSGRAFSDTASCSIECEPMREVTAAGILSMPRGRQPSNPLARLTRRRVSAAPAASPLAAR